MSTAPRSWSSEAIGVDDRRAACSRVRDTGLRNLEEDAPQRIVDLLVVLVLTLRAQALENRPESDRVQEGRVAEREVERHRQLDVPAGCLDRDPGAAEALQRPLRKRAVFDCDVELPV